MLGCLSGVLPSGVAGLLDSPDSAAGNGITPWDLADSAAESGIQTWSPGVAYGKQAKLDEQMLIVHATAAAAEHRGPSRRDDRIAPLVDALTTDRWVGTLEGREVNSRPKTDFTCAPGWSASGRAVSMHPSTTGLVATALAAAWRVRDRVRLPAALSRRIRDQLVRVARSACWRFPSPGLGGINQINWSADVQAAAATVSARPRPFWDDYRAQLDWFLEHARSAPAAGGSPIFSSRLGFHYEARRPATDAVNAYDTVEYSNIVFSALSHYDEAVRAGMAPLPASAVTRLREWASHLLYGAWAPSGYLNWDSGKGAARLHSTQYWLYAAQSFVSGLAGSRTLRLLPDQLGVAADVRRRVIGLFRHRAENAGTFDLSGTSYGLSSPQMGGPNDRKAIIGARFAELVGRYRDLDRISASTRRRGEGFADDRELGRTAVATRRGPAPVGDADRPEPGRSVGTVARVADAVGHRRRPGRPGSRLAPVPRRPDRDDLPDPERSGATPARRASCSDLRLTFGGVLGAPGTTTEQSGARSLGPAVRAAAVERHRRRTLHGPRRRAPGSGPGGDAVGGLATTESEAGSADDGRVRRAAGRDRGPSDDRGAGGSRRPGRVARWLRRAPGTTSWGAVRRATYAARDSIG